MKEILLTRGYVAFVDDEDFERLNKFNWCADVQQHTTYAKRGDCIRMHREVLHLTDPRLKTDHIDGNGLNNQKNNLRVCTQSQNLMNRIGKNKYKGVRMFRDKWRAEIRAGKKYNHIGVFDTEEDAALAYNEAAIKIHGQFANLNIVK